MAIYRDGTKRWRYRWQETQPDRSVLKLSGTPKVNTKLGAQEAERKAVADARQPKTSARPAAPTLKDYAPTFMSTWAIRNKPSERAAKESVLRVHLLPALGDKLLDQITTLDVTELVAKLLGPDPAKPLRSAKRVNNILNVLSKLLREAQEAELIAVLPKLRTLKIGTTAFEFWTFEDFEKLLASSEAEPEWRAAILVAGEAGLRAGEVAALRWEDINPRSKVLTVSRTDWRGEVGTPKGADIRHVPMTSRLAEALRSIRHLRGELVFCREDGSRLTTTNMRAALKRQEKRAGLPAGAKWHKLRHTFCSHLAMRGAPIVSIKELAGHKSVAVTNRYMHLAPGRTRSAIDLLEARG